MYAGISVLIVLVLSIVRKVDSVAGFPAGVEDVVGEVRSTFKCPPRAGYFADVDNDCKVFHVCHPVESSKGQQDIQHFMFFCGNQTVFDQSTLTCAHPEQAVPCSLAAMFFDLNDRIGREEEYFLSDQDAQRADSLRIGF
ncbi:uncharacterized protein LOC100899790 [Galendromus occidentalis]|uniref:Uncharacterized protein LOC100899790 n=1 Tax=Galendromus occidentalis TaxID=34638 RepID=A0AAJ6QSJ4_9ACAR|nr:uncharacterized protein LOC100899790 [Galendromus occidentalis]